METISLKLELMKPTKAKEQIDEWRGKMIESAILYGFTSPDTLQCSEQLDTLILQMQILHAKKRKNHSGR